MTLRSDRRRPIEPAIYPPLGAEYPALGVLRVKPADPAASYLMREIDGGPSITGGVISLPASATATVRAWIAGGAGK